MEEEITVVAKYEQFRWPGAGGDTVVISGPDPDSNIVSLKGLVDGNLKLGRPYRFFGRWGEYRGKPQFRFSSFVECTSPAGREAVVGYLTGAPRVGRATAVKIYELWGEQSVAMLREQPAAVAERIRGLTKKYAETAAAYLEGKAHVETMTIELMDLLKGRGFPKRTADLCVDKWGNRAATLVRQNPYLLMQFSGIGFKTADALYLDLGHNPGRLKRQALCATQAIIEKGNGSTWVYAGVALAALNQSIAGDEAKPTKAIRLAIRGGLLRSRYTEGLRGDLDDFGDTLWLAEAKKANDETELARTINNLLGVNG